MFEEGVTDLVTTRLRTSCALAVRSAEGVYLALVHADDTTTRQDAIELAQLVGLTEEQSVFVVIYLDPVWRIKLTQWRLRNVEDHSGKVVSLQSAIVTVRVTEREIIHAVSDREMPDTSLGAQLTSLAILLNVLLHETQPQRFGKMVLNSDADCAAVLQDLKVELEGVSELGLKMEKDDPLRPATWDKFNTYFHSKYSSVPQRTIVGIAQICCHRQDYEQACMKRNSIAQLQALKLLLIRTQTVNAVRCYTAASRPDKENEVEQRCKKWLQI